VECALIFLLSFLLANNEPGAAVMTKKELSKWNIEQVNDREIYDAIRYLEPDHETRNEHNDTAAWVIFVAVVILWLVCLWHFWSALG
jgi:hypothetical protein